jgi:hypothetical protein
MCAMGVKDAQASLNSETYHFACNAIIEKQDYNKGHWRSQVAQRAFNPLVVGSNPT